MAECMNGVLDEENTDRVSDPAANGQGNDMRDGKYTNKKTKNKTNEK